MRILLITTTNTGWMALSKWMTISVFTWFQQLNYNCPSFRLSLRSNNNIKEIRIISFSSVFAISLYLFYSNEANTSTATSPFPFDFHYTSSSSSFSFSFSLFFWLYINVRMLFNWSASIELFKQDDSLWAASEALFISEAAFSQSLLLRLRSSRSSECEQGSFQQSRWLTLLPLYFARDPV